VLTGYKLAKPALFKEQYTKGFNQFVPFVATIVAIMLTDLLRGMAIGMALGIFFVLWANYHAAFTLTRDGSKYLLRMQKDVSFLNKAPLRAILESIEDNSHLVVDGSRASFVDQDIVEMLEDFVEAANDYNIHVEMKNINGMPPSSFAK
jgi:MFS superfamily sulfate permease-like transporter